MQENYNNPKHYEWRLSVSTMEVVEEVCKDYTGIEAFYVANILKYIIRAKNINNILNLVGKYIKNDKTNRIFLISSVNANKYKESNSIKYLIFNEKDIKVFKGALTKVINSVKDFITEFKVETILEQFGNTTYNVKEMSS